MCLIILLHFSSLSSALSLIIALVLCPNLDTAVPRRLYSYTSIILLLVTVTFAAVPGRFRHLE